VWWFRGGANARQSKGGSSVNHKWLVTKTRSGRRWVAWRRRQKRKTGRVFDTWLEAVTFAVCMYSVDSRMRLMERTQ
jgi:hypothetical protein